MTTLPTRVGPTLATWALVVGGVAFFLGLFPVIGIVVGLSAIALGVLALIKGQTPWMAIVAIVLGALAGITSVVTTANIEAIMAAGREARVDSAAATPIPVASPSPSSTRATAPTPVASETPPAPSPSIPKPRPRPTPTPTPTATATASPRDYECGSKPARPSGRFLCDADFGADWPLTVPDGIVYCEVGFGPPYPITFEAPDGTTYAVNGTAMDVTDLPKIDQIWADNPGISGSKINIEPIISAGLGLCEG
ncbi:DUF2511 domain-containing protein [Microbacterium jiangjiandongii]|uniref:DUF2511 domain-containing protein n=1 Tax=Microbacterium jiangjiandongii TaxID=3049071 RepID=UPI002805F077|nr:DUF2511 domain-containing protein [Microbacterium sp. zg.Y843]